MGLLQRWWMFVFCFFMSVQSWAQFRISDLFFTKSNRDSTYLNERARYIEDYTHMLSLRTFVFLNSNRVDYFNGGVDKTIQYRPNEPFNYGFGFNYHWLGFNISFRAPDNAAGIEKRGKTNYVNLNLFSYGKTYGVELLYNYYKGFYISNPEVIRWPPNRPELPQRPDLSMENFEASFYYNFNHKRFSYRSSFIHTEQQKKSAVTFLLRPSIGWYRMDADSSITTIPEFAAHLKLDRIKHADVVNINLSPGVGGTLVIFKRIYLTAIVFAGPALEYHYADMSFQGHKDVSGWAGSLRTNARLSIGFNSKWFFCNVGTFGETYNSTLTQNSKVTLTMANVRINIGTRLDVLDRLFFPRMKDTQFMIEKN